MRVCHVCAGLAHAHHTHTHLTPQILSSAFTGPNAHSMCVCVCVMYGYHIRAGHNSDSKST